MTDCVGFKLGCLVISFNEKIYLLFTANIHDLHIIFKTNKFLKS